MLESLGYEEQQEKDEKKQQFMKIFWPVFCAMWAFSLSGLVLFFVFRAIATVVLVVSH